MRVIQIITDLFDPKKCLDEVVRFWNGLSQLGQLALFSAAVILILVVCWDFRNPNGVLFGLVVPIIHLLFCYPVSKVLFVLWYILRPLLVVAIAAGLLAVLFPGFQDTLRSWVRELQRSLQS
ncbi:hypothetical protein V1264_024318 [Littorina saxatilis]|uniref:Uncharacterized protein n=1 Tax=Littorina saxatilis TaxID=31220 RepID=A0AAN9AL97_9CAEN